jgi:D-alanyl-D-alanine carboxypeptidase (penicillin-binding protein 5/6)
VFLRDQRAPVDQFEQAHRLLDWGFALGPSVEPVGALTGPVRTDAAPQLAGSPDAAAASLAATVRGGGNRTPLTVAVSCVLVLGAAFFGRRRQVKRRMRRRRQAAAARVTARSAPLLAGRARPPRRPGGTS